MNTHLVSLNIGGALSRFLPGTVVAVSLLIVAGGAGARASGSGHKDACNAYDLGVITHTERTVLHESIVHTVYDVRVGPEQFDVIRLHRVVKEKRPYRPVQTVDALLMLPGGYNFFESVFLTPSVSSALPWDHSLSAYLAKNNIDVWGMDYAWSLVPKETTDFGFMEGWGLERDMRHADIALRVARRIRAFTGQGFGRMHLLGFSYGLPIAYALAGEETQKPGILRKIKGIIPVDMLVKTDLEEERLSDCEFALGLQDKIDAGTYQGSDGVFLNLVGELAANAPDEMSDIVPGWTNQQFARYVGTSGAVWHFVGGTLQELFFTDDQVWLDLLQSVPPYTPVQGALDEALGRCDVVDVPFDDHMGEITLPILYVAGAGGHAELGLYDLTLVASTDITVHMVQLLEDDEKHLDFGHGDLLVARDAEELVWEPIWNWINAHAPRRGGWWSGCR